jgi:hypothetical protein
LTKSVVLLSILAAVPTALAQDQCVSLAGSKACPAFNASSVSVTGSVADLLYVLILSERPTTIFPTQLTSLFTSPFLKNVKDTASFDQKLLSHVQTSYVQDK